MIFVREVKKLNLTDLQTRPLIIKEFPRMNILDVMKEIGRRWQKITPEHKQHFEREADKDKIRFRRE